MSSSPTDLLPTGFTAWPPVLQAATLGVLTFVQEDVPTIAASLLAAGGAMGWWPAFIGCFLGIWIGDALLYGTARVIGRPLLTRAWTRRWIRPEAVARSEDWFAQRGLWLLVVSRLVPGTRLPTYLAAGFLRLHFGRFLLVTGLAVAVWTTLIFGLAHWLGAGLVTWLQRWTSGAFAVVLVAGVLVLGWRLLPGAVRALGGLRYRLARARWARWEFWPSAVFYLPVAFHYLILAIQHRSFTLPSAANPGMFSGGLVGESKIATLAELQATSPEFTAEAHPLNGPVDRRIKRLAELLANGRLAYPFILKPDAGQRGVGVKLIRHEAQARAYLQQVHAPVIAQRYAPGPHEAGVFYYRFPDQPRGRILALTEKIFPVLTGNGRHTIKELIQQDPRARFMAAKYLQRFAGRHDEVLPTDQNLKLVEAGNHAQGCIFRDGMHLWSAELEARIDDISRKLNGFYIGRYDLRYATVEELRAGQRFEMVELNGAASEVTSIYDARNTLGSAYRTLFNQWRLVFAIG
jgi:membrane protein DedA with SNARE-associated domain